MAGTEGNGVEATTKWGGIKLQGPVAVSFFFTMGIAIILLMALLGVIPSPMTQMVSVVENNSRILAQHTADTNVSRQQLVAAMEYQNMLMRAICYRLSDSKEQALQCEPGYRGYPEEELKYYDRPTKRPLKGDR